MKKELVILTDSFPKLTETFIARQIQYLQGAVVTRTFNKDLCYLFKEIDYSHVTELGKKKNKGTVITFIEKVVRKLLRRPTYLWDHITRSAFESYIHANRPAVVLAQFGPLGINALPACKKYNIPLVVQFFGYDASSLLHDSNYVSSIKEVFQYAKKIVVLNSDMRKAFIELTCPADKIEIINVGVPVNEITPEERKIKSPFQFLTVGRLIPKKSPIDTLKAFHFCYQNNPDVFLTMVGDGPLMNTAMEFIKKHQLEQHVALTGNLSQQELKKYYQEAHVFLQHSVTSKDGNAEGWPVGIAEACAYELPIVSTLHKGIKDQVVQGVTGYLVEEYDHRKMGEYMLELSLDPGKSISMGKASRQHMLKTGNLVTQIEKLKTVIQEAKQ